MAIDDRFNILRHNSESVTQEMILELAESLSPELVKIKGYFSEKQQESILKLAASTIVAERLLDEQKQEDNVSFSIHELNPEEIGQQGQFTEHEHIGMATLSVGQWLTIHLPDLSRPERAAAAISVINDLHNEELRTKFWVFDFSAVQSLPVDLVSYLLGLNQSLKRQGSRVLFLWVGKDAITPALSTSLTKHFGLRKKGVFYISAETIPDVG